MNKRGGDGATRPAAAPASPRHSPSFTTTFARTSSCASPSPRDAVGRAERPCMAFRLDAGPAGVEETARAPRLAIPVGRLGGHDASFRYARSAVTFRQGDTTWKVFLNVHPDAIGEPVDSGSGLWQDEEGQWHARGDVDYKEFCAAANSSRVCPEPVQVIRRWASCRRGAGKERRPPAPDPRRPRTTDTLLERVRASGGPRSGRDGPQEPARADGGGTNYYAPLRP